ncbi:MAG: ribosomal protein S18-alanine N-acetyltransferase [Syntrophobacterales bacterium]|nr:ribosomal protein S18-alanine N-acetyltransferase [Syntrophobacterales bacterium]
MKNKTAVETVVDIETRDMTMDDLEEVLSIESVSFPTPWSEGMFLEEMKHSFCHDLVGLVEGQIIGYISFAIVYDEIHLRNIAVHKDWKRCNVASRLLSMMINISSGRGARYATLEVRESNEAALELYKKFGFVVKGTRPFYYTDTGENALIMWADF